MPIIVTPILRASTGSAASGALRTWMSPTASASTMAAAQQVTEGQPGAVRSQTTVTAAGSIVISQSGFPRLTALIRTQQLWPMTRPKAT